MVEVAEIIVHEGDEPNVLVYLLNSDAVAGEDDAEIDLLPIEADAAACGDGDGLAKSIVYTDPEGRRTEV